jgi:chromosome segregation ATPase
MTGQLSSSSPSFVLKCLLQLTAIEAALSELQQAHATLQSEKSQLETELSTQRSLVTELKQLLQAESGKNVELGSELLTLLNQKEVCVQRADKLETELSLATAKIAVM